MKQEEASLMERAARQTNTPQMARLNRGRNGAARRDRSGREKRDIQGRYKQSASVSDQKTTLTSKRTPQKVKTRARRGWEKALTKNTNTLGAKVRKPERTHTSRAKKAHPNENDSNKKQRSAHNEASH